MAFKKLIPGRSVVDRVKEQLETSVVDQPQAIKRFVKNLAIMISGLRFRTRPVVMFFSGPSGVGKTLLAQTAARALGSSFIVINMEQFAQEHTVARLEGSPPGYVYGEPLLRPELISTDHTKPTIILLDEFEKTHPKVQQALLGIFDQGKMTIYLKDPRFKDFPGHVPTAPVTLDLTNCIFILTSNIGSRELVSAQKGNAIGFSADRRGDRHLSHHEVFDITWKELQRVLAPELISRIGEKRFVAFNSLSGASYVKIIDLGLERLAEDVINRYGYSFTLNVSDAVKEVILRKGTRNPTLGARDILDTIENEILDKLAPGINSEEDAELEGMVSKLHPGDVINLDLDANGEIVVEVDTTGRPLFVPVPVEPPVEQPSALQQSRPMEAHVDDASDEDDEPEEDQAIVESRAIVMQSTSRAVTDTMNVWFGALVHLADTMTQKEMQLVISNLMEITIDLDITYYVGLADDKKVRVVETLLDMIRFIRPTKDGWSDIFRLINGEEPKPRKPPPDSNPKKAPAKRKTPKKK